MACLATNCNITASRLYDKQTNTNYEEVAVDCKGKPTFRLVCKYGYSHDYWLYLTSFFPEPTVLPVGFIPCEQTNGKKGILFCSKEVIQLKFEDI